MMGKRPVFINRDGERYWQAFAMGFLALFAVLLPLMIIDKGYFIYYGDFVSQQLPFYELANDAARSGQLGWNWYTDLGGSFIGCYAFYLAGSPFFWLSVLLPEKLVLYAIPWLLSLKHGIASMAAYGYIRRFVRNKDAALIGGLLYAFSGFQVFNIFFNHFQDVTAFFPLMLIAMEECVNNNRRGWFALSVALMAVINYFFFAGQVVFLILYFFIRCICPDFHINFKKLVALAAEAVIGVCISAFMFLPAALAVIQNTRVDSCLVGEDVIFYSDKTRILRIIQSFFMIPDAPARPNLYQSGTGKWASIGGYLPLFSMAGVITFMRSRKKHWATILVWIAVLCAFIPFLNSGFYMFNSSYYARWYYMPILVMAMMTAQALDDKKQNWKTGITICGVMLAFFGICFCIPTLNDDKKTEFFKFAALPEYFLIVLAASILCFAGCYYVYRLRRSGKPFFHQAVPLTFLACMITTGTIVYFGKAIGVDADKYIRTAIHGEENISISYETDDADYFRVDMSEDYDNYPMFWGLSSMRAFQSTVTPSIMEFYDSIGITRDVASRAEPASYTLRGLFSVKYYFDRVRDDMEDLHIPGFTYLRTENEFKIYENEYFIPMGFPYDAYVTPDMLEDKSKPTKERILIRALVLTDEQAQKYEDILKPVSSSLNLSEEDYLRACTEHRDAACRNFTYDSRHFSGEIRLDKPQLVFFSVPYESGWTAAVNGKPADVEKVSGGFMAVRCEAGESTIEFRYETPGFRAGLWLTAAGILLLFAYIGLSAPLFKDRFMGCTHSYDYVPTDSVGAADAYTRHLLGIIEQRSTEERKDEGNGASV